MEGMGKDIKEYMYTTIYCKYVVGSNGLQGSHKICPPSAFHAATVRHKLGLLRSTINRRLTDMSTTLSAV